MRTLYTLMGIFQVFFVEASKNISGRRERNKTTDSGRMVTLGDRRILTGLQASTTIARIRLTTVHHSLEEMIHGDGYS
jgi:hypothetical protein